MSISEFRHRTESHTIILTADALPEQGLPLLPTAATTARNRGRPRRVVTEWTYFFESASISDRQVASANYSSYSCTAGEAPAFFLAYRVQIETPDLFLKLLKPRFFCIARRSLRSRDVKPVGARPGGTSANSRNDFVFLLSGARGTCGHRRLTSARFLLSTTTIKRGIPL